MKSVYRRGVCILFRQKRIKFSQEESDMKPSEEVKNMFEQDRFATDNGAYIEEVDDHTQSAV